jgi:hypothetical protein
MTTRRTYRKIDRDLLEVLVALSDWIWACELETEVKLKPH